MADFFGMGPRMKRFILFFMVILLITWSVRFSHRGHPRRDAARWPARQSQERDRNDRLIADESDDDDESHETDVRRALAEARTEIRAAWKEARREIHEAYTEVKHSIAGEKHRVPAVPSAPPFPGAPPEPPAPPTLAFEAEKPAEAAKTSVAKTQSPESDIRKIAGQISATEDRAKDDARRALQVAVQQWLGADVPASWTPPARLIDRMIRSTHIQAVIKEYGTLYIAELEVDTSPARRNAIVETYNRELVRHRLLTLGGSLAFVLTCLAAFAGYVRADEATKGYYTNGLRTLVAASIGAAGVLIYQIVA